MYCIATLSRITMLYPHGEQRGEDEDDLAPKAHFDWTHGSPKAVIDPFIAGAPLG